MKVGSRCDQASVECLYFFRDYCVSFYSGNSNPISNIHEILHRHAELSLHATNGNLAAAV